MAYKLSDFRHGDGSPLHGSRLGEAIIVALTDGSKVYGTFNGFSLEGIYLLAHGEKDYNKATFYRLEEISNIELDKAINKEALDFVIKNYDKTFRELKDR